MKPAIPWQRYYKKKKKKSGKDTSRKGNYHPIPLMNVDAQILNKLQPNLTQ